MVMNVVYCFKMKMTKIALYIIMVLSFFFDKKTPTFPNVPQNHKVILCLCTPSCENKSDNNNENENQTKI
jgi:hypothetical protein